LLLLLGEVGAFQHARGLLLEQLMHREIAGDDAVVGRERGIARAAVIRGRRVAVDRAG
jgi:hypothetical protein